MRVVGTIQKSVMERGSWIETDRNKTWKVEPGEQQTAVRYGKGSRVGNRHRGRT